jgi:3-phenylpropionate/trans-cinnamate dioxygenase ferredoxin reductase component
MSMVLSMRKFQFLLVGGGITAVSAARQIALCEPAASISIINNEPHVPYDRPPLSKGFLAGNMTISDLKYSHLDELPSLSVANDHVVQLDPVSHTARLLSGETIVFERCLIATGGYPRRANIPGAYLKGVHLFRTVSDAEAVRADAKPGRRCVIVGAGFIGLELAGTFTQMGLTVEVLGRSSVWPQFDDAELSIVLRKLCEARGAVFHLGSPVRKLCGSDHVSSVVLSSGVELHCDFVVLCLGIEPNVEIAREAGILVRNGIIVDHHFQTSVEDIYAAGDVCNFMDGFAGTRRRIEHWGHAEYSGQVTGRNMAGVPTEYNFLNYVWSDISDIRLDYAGYHSGREERAVRGTLGEKGSCIFYLRRGSVVAYCAFNAPQRDLAVYNRLIKSAVMVSPDRLSDQATDLVRLVRDSRATLVTQG